MRVPSYFGNDVSVQTSVWEAGVTSAAITDAPRLPWVGAARRGAIQGRVLTDCPRVAEHCTEPKRHERVAGALCTGTPLVRARDRDFGIKPVYAARHMAALPVSPTVLTVRAALDLRLHCPRVPTVRAAAAPAMAMVSKIRYRRFENRILRSVSTTDCEQYNALRQLLEDTRTALRAYLDLLQKNDSTWRCLSRRTRKLTRAFVRNFPGDHADHRVVAKATAQAIHAAPPSGTIPDRERAEAERAATNAAPVVTKLVHDYLSELDAFYVTKFHRIETTYRRVALHREIHKLLVSAKNTNEEKLQANRHKLDVHDTAYKLALDQHLPTLTRLMDKRFVAFKAVRVAYWSAQLRAFDSVRDSLCRNMGVACEPAVLKLDEASMELSDYVSTYVERLAAICIKTMSPSEVECYIPTAQLDDACEHSFHKVAAVVGVTPGLPDPRFATPPTSKTNDRIFRVFSPRMGSARRLEGPRVDVDMAPRNLSMPPSSASPLSLEPAQMSGQRASLPDELRFDLREEVSVNTPMSPVSSLDGHTTTPGRAPPDDHEEPVLAPAKRVMSAPRPRGVNVWFLKRKFEAPKEV